MDVEVTEPPADIELDHRLVGILKEGEGLGLAAFPEVPEGVEVGAVLYRNWYVPPDPGGHGTLKFLDLCLPEGAAITEVVVEARSDGHAGDEAPVGEEFS